MSDVKLWTISNFDVGPHWEAAIVRADTAEAAKSALAAKIGTDDDDHPDTVWEPQPQDKWSVTEVADDEPVVFLLGAGCR